MSEGPVQRKIIHVDMDAFFASVEQRDNPSLRGRPVAVGSAAPRGVVAAASYEARAFGVRSAMPSVTARRKCPELVFVPPRFEVYRAVSAQIRAVFAEHTDLIEPLSLDEAYLDVTVNRQGFASATDLAQVIRARIHEVTGLTASAGVSYCKFLAKMASGMNKPDGQTVITPRQGPAFIEALPVAKFHGVGPATAARMAALGLRTGADLRAFGEARLRAEFGKSGGWYWRIAQGIDERPVQPDRERKSFGAEDTFARDLETPEAVLHELAVLAEKLWSQAGARGIRARGLVVKIKFADFRIVTRSRTQVDSFVSLAEVTALCHVLASSVFPLQQTVRLVGVTFTSLGGEDAVGPERPSQLALFPL